MPSTVVGKSPVVRQEIESVVGLPLPTSRLKTVPEVLILDKDNSPKVSTQLIQTGPLILGAKLKCVPYIYAFH
jgi:hypothetical protein